MEKYLREEIMYQSTSHNLTTQLFRAISTNDARIKRYNKYLLTIKKTHTHILFHFKEEVIVTSHHGKALIVITNNPDQRSSFEFYILDGAITIPPGVYFNTLSLTPESTIYLQSQEHDQPQTVNLLKKVSAKQYHPQVQIKDIFAISQHMLRVNDRIEIDNTSYFEWIITLKGDVQHEFNGKIMEVGQKSAILYPPNHQVVLIHGAGEPAEYLSICFSLLPEEFTLPIATFNLSNFDWQLIQDIMNHSLSMFDHCQGYDADKMVAMVSTLLLSYLRDEGKPMNHPVSSMRTHYESNLFQEMVHFLKENIEERNEVSDLCDAFKLSRSTIQNLFQKYANTTPKTYINHIRLNRSKELMKHTSLSISQIAEKLGYGSLPYFSRAFTQEFGMTPSAYAKSMIK